MLSESGRKRNTELFIGTELLFGMMKKVLATDNSDSCTTCQCPELHTERIVKTAHCMLCIFCHNKTPVKNKAIQ